MTPTLLDDSIIAFNSVFLATNNESHNSEIDDLMSETTTITILFIGDTLFVANVSDSRVVIAVKESKTGIKSYICS